MSWILQRAALRGRAGLWDLNVDTDTLRIAPTQLAASTPPAAPPALDAEGGTWDLAGRLVLPGLVELHTHLDKTFTPSRNPEGTLIGAIEHFNRVAASRTADAIEANADRALRTAVSRGVTRLRSHLNLGNDHDLEMIAIMVDLRQRYADRLTLQLVGMAGLDGSAKTKQLIEAALQLGIDQVGGAPALAENPAANVAATLDAAQAHGIPVDLHIDENEDPSSRTLEAFAVGAIERQLTGPLTASHCCSLAFMAAQERDAILARVADAGIGVVALPECNLVLMGRSHWPVPRGSAPVKALQAAGVPVAAGSDNVQDAFNPFGGYDPLASASLAAKLNQLTSDSELDAVLDLVTADAGRLFDGHPGVIEDGASADLVVLDAYDERTVVADPPPRLATFKSGRRVYAQSRAEHYSL
ncbi:MAG: amidohydrolase family protein [Pseudomonadota bacterium]